jgi:hypothetical protein
VRAVTRRPTRDHELVRASLAALAQRLDRLVGALAHRDAELEATRATIAALWARVERLERRSELRAIPGRPEPAPTSAQRWEEVPAAARRRVPLGEAAELLGVGRDHVLRLGRAGALDLMDLRSEDADRARWVVTLESIERLAEQRRARPARPAHPDPEPPGRRTRDDVGG